MENKRGRGRPAKDQNDAKTHAIRVRMNDREWEALQELSRKTDLSKSEVIRMSVIHYNGAIRY